MNFGNLLEKTYEAITALRLRGLATSGTTTTIVDTSLATKLGTNALRDHIAFISRTTDGLAPQAQYGLLGATNYTPASQTITIPTVTAAVGAGDEYAIMKPLLNLYQMQSQVNLAMALLPAIRLPNTSLTVVADQYVYAIPLAAAHYQLQEVYTGNDTDGWIKETNWNIHPDSAGNTPDLVFGSIAGDAGDTIKLIYLGKQTGLDSYDDAISELYPDEMVYAACAWTALKHYMTIKGLMINRRWTPILQEAEKRWMTAQATNPVRNAPAASRRTIELGRLP